jgi:CRP/FNR family cyclic AMP-dependent transcriptional regulator
MTTELTKIWHIDSINLFQGLSYEEKLRIEKLTVTRSFDKNEHIYFPNDPSTDIYFVASGRVKIAKAANNGKENIRSIVYEGEMFGEIGMVAGDSLSKRRDYAQSMEDETLVCVISYENMRTLIQQHPILNEKVTQQITKRLTRTEKRLESIMFKDARSRLVEFIKELAKDLGKPVGHEILVKHKLTHQEIANITAISRQKVTTLLNELKQENLIYLERKSILIRNMEALK